LAEAGEIIPGYQFVEATERFSIKFASGKDAEDATTPTDTD
jgi:hypothetical protein